MLVVDDHAVVRASVVRLLASEPEIEVVGVAADGAKAVALSRELRPDVVVMDLCMPVLDGVEAIRQIVASGQRTRVLVFTSSPDRECLTRARVAGAVGHVLKDEEPQELLARVLQLGSEAA